MLITKKIEFDMGHRVPNHKSKCRNFHGHRYVAEVGVDDKVIQTPGASDEGMVIDFSDLKQIMVQKIEDVLDHGFMMSDLDPLNEEFSKICRKEDLKLIVVPFVPTAENIAREIYFNILKALEIKGIKLAFVKVWETPNSTATYDGTE